MPLFLKTDKDPDGKSVRVDAGFRTKSGTAYLMLTRLPPHYPKPPGFIVELSSDPIALRVGEHTKSYLKAYAIQGFSVKELVFLRDAPEGTVSLPLFGGGMSRIAKTMGKSFHKLTNEELAAVVNEEPIWKLIGGQR